MTCSTVMPPDITNELIRKRPNGAKSQAAEKLSACQAWGTRVGGLARTSLRLLNADRIIHTIGTSVTKPSPHSPAQSTSVQCGRRPTSRLAALSRSSESIAALLIAHPAALQQELRDR